MRNRAKTPSQGQPISSTRKSLLKNKTKTHSKTGLQTTNLNKNKKKNRRKKATTIMNDKSNLGHVLTQTKAGLSANWQAFLKETKEKEQPNGKSNLNHSCKDKNNGERGILKTSSKKIQIKRKLEKDKINDVKKAVNEEVIDEKDIWFDDVDMEDIEHATGKKIKVAEKTSLTILTDSAMSANSNENHTLRETKYVAIDCEMVGVGIDGKDSMLARVSLVNAFGETIYDKFVAPMQNVVDYRTEFSGVRPADLKGAPDFLQVQAEVAALTKGKILVGHSINNDLKVLLLSHPRKSIRDTANYKPFKKMLKTRYPSLKKLTKEILQVDIQSGEHSSVEDARCTMKIFQLHRKNWEKSLKEKGHKLTVDNVPKIFMGKKDAENARNFRKKKKNERRKKKESSTGK